MIGLLAAVRHRPAWLRWHRPARLAPAPPVTLHTPEPKPADPKPEPTPRYVTALPGAESDVLELLADLSADTDPLTAAQMLFGAPHDAQDRS